MTNTIKISRDALILIQSIASGSTTANSLPNLARIADEALAKISQLCNAPNLEKVNWSTSIWNDALEEAALICDSVNNHDNPMTAGDCADAIREMKAVKAPDENYQWNEGDDEHS